jgi:hypothetical protein
MNTPPDLEGFVTSTSSRFINNEPLWKKYKDSIMQINISFVDGSFDV